MYSEVFIKDLSELGRVLDSFLKGELEITHLDEAVKQSFESNPLFERSMQISALKAVSSLFLKESALRGWIKEYSYFVSEKEFEVMIIMAGNIPLVGFHDLLSVLASGRIAAIKLSAKDRFLIPAICRILYNINSYWEKRISFRDTPDESPKMVIATGGDETAAYFRSRYPGIPSLIRGAKCSVALLRGDEDDRFTEELAKDVFLYYGMGCRSVSTILIPEKYDLKKLTEKFAGYSYIAEGEYFHDAYRYQKALSSVSEEWFIDGGFFILKKNCTLPPPLGVVGIIEYKDEKEIENFIATNIKSLQCIVNFNYENHFIPFGSTQFPSLSDYADGVNTLEFILKNS